MWARLESLRRRKRQPEVMDQPGLDERLHHEALRDLAGIHRLTGTVRRLWPPIRRLAREGPVRVLDLACGGGAVAIDLALRARREGLAVEIEGADLSPVALEYARREAARAGVDVRFVKRDALTAAALPECDVVLTSLFLHHLARTEVVALLAEMAQAADRLVLSDDLIRSYRGWIYTYTASRLFFRSPVVRVDGLLSVEAAFTPDELRQLVERAGLVGGEVSTSWPQRQLLTWRKR